ncbi:MAG: tol-pal system YbgF family protein [bacterium]
MPELETGEDYTAPDSDYDSEYKSDLMRQLASLDESSTELESDQRNEILQALGIEPAGGENIASEKDFLTDSLFMDLESEIAELQTLSSHKDVIIDSLRLEMEEVDHEFVALNDLTTKPDNTLRSSSLLASTGDGVGLPAYEYGDSPYALSYQDALDDVYSKNFSQAIEKFHTLLQESTNDDLSDNCQYWIGQCYYSMGKYQLAITEFEKVFAFDKNNKEDDAQFMIGMAYLKIGESQLAQFELTNLLDFFNKSEYVNRAESRLTDLNI